jgi:hypothetical protein
VLIVSRPLSFPGAAARPSKAAGAIFPPPARPPTGPQRSPQRAWLIRARTWLAALAFAFTATLARADSVVVFNEIMYHPATNEAALEWVELHNQMAVDVDLSGWSLTGGVNYEFAEGTVMPGGGYLVVAVSPTTLMGATGLTNVLGPFSGRLSNDGEQLSLRNRNQRLMDRVEYGVDGHWPVAPDGAGVSLVKRDQVQASAPARNWTISPLLAGTPGRRNFAVNSVEVTNSTPLLINGSWRFEASGADLGTAWRERAFDDQHWSTGQALFKAGNITAQAGEPLPVPTLFSSGMGADGTIQSPGLPDPHYQLTQSAHSAPPPPSIAATVIQNHPAWYANDAFSSWIGAINPGTTAVAAGDYHYRTTFSLSGFDPTTAALTLRVGADNRLNDVLLNGVSQGISYAGFASLSGSFSITNGFVADTNTLDFRSANDGTGANPAGFRVRLSGTARQLIPSNTALPVGRTNYYFRSSFTLDSSPRMASLRLSAVIADGAVFYLNGTEVLRWNLPAGPVTSRTHAVTNVPSPAYVGPFALPNSALLAGTNILAVELHAAPGAGLTNVLFGAALELTTTNQLVPPPVSLALNEVAAGTNGEVWLELMNFGSEPLDLDGCVVTRQGAGLAQSYTFPAQTLGPGDFELVTAAMLGFSPVAGDRLFLYAAGGGSVLDAVVVKDVPRGRWPDGVGGWWFPTALTPGASNYFVFQHDVVINEIMYHAPLLPPEPATIGTNVLLSITNSWRYHSLGADLGTAWRSPAYDDVAWPDGRSLFYNTASALPAPKNTLLPLVNEGGTRIITWYFRTPFVYAGGTNSAQLTFSPIVDDGAVYYLNGVEFFRQNLPAGEIRYTNLASVGVATPAYSGPFTVAVTNLLDGTNLLAVEVHQFTTNPIAADMAFGVDLRLSGQQSPALPTRESPESWIELHNRGTNAVDLTGWRLDEGVDFRFAAGTTIPAGGYLVVAKDLDYMAAHYPSLSIVGPFTNQLSRSDDLLVLKDAANNPADEVHYFDSGRWPEDADGGGSSLELRDPWADNSQAAAWSGSEESARVGWSTFTYRATAQNVLGPTQWNEFILGLLDAGECLVDDLHVVESPDTAPVELLQNGSFEPGLTAWRALGTHRQSRVEVDPANPANHVLHLVSTGPTDHMHNHLETTLANNRAITDGKTYEISFRARWLAGNPRLNTRLYFNRVARTTALPLPAQHGTPGARNSTYTTNLGPTFTGFQHSPVVPAPGEPVTVSVNVADPHGLGAVTLRWSANSGVWQSAPMSPGSGSAPPGYASYSATLAGLAAGTLVQFCVEATDSLGAGASFPAGGTNSRALFRVNDGKPLMGQLHRLALLMLPADAQWLHADTNVMSNDPIGLTLVQDEREVFYDVDVHLQSSERGRSAPSRVGFTVRMHPDQRFRGVQKNFTIDRSGGYSGLGGSHDELLLWHAANHAGGGLLGLECDLVQVFAPRASEDGTGLLRLAAFDSDYFDSQFAAGDQGNRYMLELIYYPTTTATGDPQSPKLPQPDNVVNVDLQNWGADPEYYRWMLRQENRADLDDYSQAVALCQAFSLSGTALDARSRQLLDVDEYLRTLAFAAFTGVGDFYTFDLNHNWKLYFRPEDGRALGLLWDMDFSFVKPVNSSFPGAGSAGAYRLVMLPDNYRRYYHHLLDLLTTTINSAHLSPWAARYAGLLGQDWSGAVNYLQQRANYLRGTMPLSTAFAITSNGGNNFGTTNSSVALSGTAPLTVKEIHVNGTSYALTWSSLTNWTLTVPLPAVVNLLALQGVNSQGAPVTNATDSIIVTNRGLLPPGPVVINEWMADNAGPGGFADPLDGLFQDWIELYNPNDVAVNLSGFHLTDTLATPAKWQFPTNTVIVPHGFLLIWADGDTTQNGLGNQGDLHASFSLSKGGEAIGLYAANGSPQHTVIFGSQVENVSQGLYPDGNTNTVVTMPDWSPRTSNRLGAPAAPVLGSFLLPGDGTISFAASVIPGRTYRVEFKDSLASTAWTPLGGNVTATESLLRIEDALGSRPQRYYRVSLLQ